MVHVCAVEGGFILHAMSILERLPATLSGRAARGRGASEVGAISLESDQCLEANTQYQYWLRPRPGRSGERRKCKYMERVGVSGRPGYRWKALGELSKYPGPLRSIRGNYTL